MKELIIRLELYAATLLIIYSCTLHESHNFTVGFYTRKQTYNPLPTTNGLLPIFCVQGSQIADSKMPSGTLSKVASTQNRRFPNRLSHFRRKE